MNRSVAGIACKEGRFFIAKRLPGGDLGGKWEFPGGKAKAGEADADALCRELFEELGVKAAVGGFVGSADFFHKGKGYTLSAYSVSFDAENIAMSEHSEWRWAGSGEIEKLDFAESDLKLLPAVKAAFPGSC